MTIILLSVFGVYGFLVLIHYPFDRKHYVELYVEKEFWSKPFLAIKGLNYRCGVIC